MPLYVYYFLQFFLLESTRFFFNPNGTTRARSFFSLHGEVNVRAHASSVLHDKLIVFGGVRDKAGRGEGENRRTVVFRRLGENVVVKDFLEKSFLWCFLQW